MPFRASVHDSSSEILKATDANLFELMEDSEKSPEKANSAWAEFYRRYSAYLWNCCLKVCRTATEGDRLAKDIFQATMHKIYNQAKTYQPEKGNGIKAWISRVAHNEFIDYYNKYNANFSSYETPPEIEDEVEDESKRHEFADELVSLRVEQLKSILERLSKKEFKILMTYMNYFQIDRPKSHIPDTEMAKLCEEFNIKSDAVRQIKRRALLRLQKFASELKPHN